MFNSLQPHGLQHARLPFSSLSPRACSNSCPLSPWCHSNISSSVTSFSSCPQSFPASGSFPMSQLFISSGQSIGILASEALFPVRIHSWFPLRLTGLISLMSKGLLSILSGITIWKHQYFSTQPSLQSNCHMTTGKTIALTGWLFVGKVMSLLFNMLSRLAIAFLPRNKRLLISWLHSFQFFPFYLPWSDGSGCRDVSHAEG